MAEMAAGAKEGPDGKMGEIARFVMAMVVVCGGFAAIVAFAWFRSIDDATKFAGIVSGIIGGIIGYFFAIKNVDDAHRQTDAAREEGEAVKRGAATYEAQAHAEVDDAEKLAREYAIQKKLLDALAHRAETDETLRGKLDDVARTIRGDDADEEGEGE